MSLGYNQPHLQGHTESRAGGGQGKENQSAVENQKLSSQKPCRGICHFLEISDGQSHLFLYQQWTVSPLDHQNSEALELMHGHSVIESSSSIKKQIMA